MPAKIFATLRELNQLNNTAGIYFLNGFLFNVIIKSQLQNFAKITVKNNTEVVLLLCKM